MLKEVSIFLAVIGIIMSCFARIYPKVGAIGVPIGMAGLLGITIFS